MDILIRILVFVLGLALAIATFFSAISTFVLPRSARSKLNRTVFGLLLRLFKIPLRFASTFEQRDAIMAYYAPLGLMLLVPAWYVLISIGYAGMYWSLGVPGWMMDFRLSGSSLLTLGLAASDDIFVNILVFSEATLGLVLVALLIAYLPTMYSAFSRREQAVNLVYAFPITSTGGWATSFFRSQSRLMPVLSEHTSASRSLIFSLPSSIAWIVGAEHSRASAISFCVKPTKMRRTASV